MLQHVDWREIRSAKKRVVPTKNVSAIHSPRMLPYVRMRAMRLLHTPPSITTLSPPPLKPPRPPPASYSQVGSYGTVHLDAAMLCIQNRTFPAPPWQYPTHIMAVPPRNPRDLLATQLQPSELCTTLFNSLHYITYSIHSKSTSFLAFACATLPRCPTCPPPCTTDCPTLRDNFTNHLSTTFALS